MATKINTDYYGAENTFVNLSTTTQVKRCANNVGQLLTDGKYTGGSFDTSASPWGIGKSSISSDFFFLASQAASWTIYSYTNQKKNTPLWLYNNPVYVLGGNDPSGVEGSSATSAFFSLAAYKNRIDPAVNISGNTILSSLAVDNNARIDIPSSSGQYPITYANYHNLRLAIVRVWVKPTNSNSIVRTDMTAIKNGNVSVDKLIRFEFGLFDTSGNGTGVQFSVGGGEIDIPEVFQTCYYGDTYKKWVRPWRRIGAIGYWLYNTSDLSLGYYTFPSSEASYTSYWETLSDRDNMTQRADANAWGHMSETMQAFDNVSYHWEWGISPAADSQFTINPIQTGDAYSSTTLRNFGYMVFDDEPDNKNMACFNAILHEVAFLGFPIVISTSDYAENIGSDKVYLPVFDEHLITTGEFVNGSASLNLPNATWGDIFGEEMPEYDPEYDPDAPEPGEEDQGDLSNSYPNRYSNAGGLAQWVLSYNGVEDLAAFLNGSYLPTSADLDADFKGTNPQDYVVSVQKYPFTLPMQSIPVPTDIYIGKINSGIKGKKLYDDTFAHAVNAQSTFDFGAIDIPEYYGDFRDYQSKILLFMPFIGTDELDPKLYIGSTLSLIYKVDYNTGSVAAEIKRNGLTMETKTGNISITIPFMAANMGAYQNQLAQLSYAKDLTKIKGIGTALSAGFTMAAGAQATMSTGQPPLAAGSNLAQAGVQLAANATQLSQLDYQIEHTAPSVGTISTAAAANAFFLDDRARLIIIRPKTLAGFDSAAYAHTVGHACCIAGKLSDFSGYTIAAAAELNNITTKSAHYAATEQELELIKKALQTGIYL